MDGIRSVFFKTGPCPAQLHALVQKSDTAFSHPFGEARVAERSLMPRQAGDADREKTPLERSLDCALERQIR